MFTYFKTEINNLLFNSHFVFQHPKPKEVPPAETAEKKKLSEKPVSEIGKEIIQKAEERIKENFTGKGLLERVGLKEVQEKLDLQGLKNALKSTEILVQIGKMTEKDNEILKLSEKINMVTEKEKKQIQAQMVKRFDENIIQILTTSGFSENVIKQYLKEAKTDSIFQAMLKHQSRDSSKKLIKTLVVGLMYERLTEGKGLFEGLGIDIDSEVQNPEDAATDIKKAIKSYSESHPAEEKTESQKTGKKPEK